MTGQNSVRIAAISPQQAGGSNLEGVTVQPASWSFTGLPYQPELWDARFPSLPPGPARVALVGMDFVFGWVDNQTKEKWEAAKLDEPTQVRRGIRVVGAGNMSSRALDIASRGGVAWQHPNRMWLYMVDGRGLPVADFMPTRWITLARPDLPLHYGAKGFGTSLRRGSGR